MTRTRPSAELGVLFLTAIACVYLTQLRFSLSFQFEEAASFELLVAGTADRPFQYRLLVPSLAGGLISLLPIEKTPETLSAVFACFECVALFTLAVSFASLLGRLGLGGEQTGVAALCLLWVLPFCFLLYPGPKFFYPWDTPAVLFWVLALSALHDRAIGRFYAIFAVATLNRETSIFFTLLFSLTSFESYDRRALSAHIALQIAIWLLIKGLLSAAFAVNGGAGLFDMKIMDNIGALTDPPALLAILSACGFLGLPLALLHGRISRPFVRRAALVAPPFALGMLCVANLWEVRVFAELTPIALLGYLDLCSNRRAPPGGTD